MFARLPKLPLHTLKAIAKACGCNSATLYQYFDNLDDLIVKSTEYCMSKVEDDFMSKAPTDVEDLWRFIDEIPYWTANIWENTMNTKLKMMVQ